MSRKGRTSSSLGARISSWLERCGKRTSGCVVSAIRCILIATAIFATSVECSAKIDPEDIMSVDSVYPGQNYGDTIYYSVLKPYKVKGKYYALVGEDAFITALGTNKCFLFKWYPKTSESSWSSKAVKINTDNEGNQFKTSGSGVSKTVLAIESAGLSIYTCSGVPVKILSLFDQSVIDSGFVLGVVDSNLQYAYDISDRTTWYSTQGSVRSWDGVTYQTDLGGNESPNYETLDDRGNKALTEDLLYGVKWIEEKRKGAAAMTPTLEKTNIVYRTEKVQVTNVEYYYVTNKTVVVNPDLKGLDSVLDFTYPKYSTEGTNGLYTVNRDGTCSDELTIHILTNGYFCGNLTWKSGESGRKSLRIHYGIEDEFDDNRPLEILIKSLNRKVGTRISQE